MMKSLKISEDKGRPKIHFDKVKGIFEIKGDSIPENAVGTYESVIEWLQSYVKSPNPVYSWGYDFNHESDHTKYLVDRVLRYWIEHFQIDGFRLDFTLKSLTSGVNDFIDSIL